MLLRARSSPVECSVRNGKVAGATPAESNKLLGKKFNQEALIKFGDKSAGGSGCGCGVGAIASKAFACEHGTKTAYKALKAELDASLPYLPKHYLVDIRKQLMQTFRKRFQRTLALEFLSAFFYILFFVLLLYKMCYRKRTSHAQLAEMRRMSLALKKLDGEIAIFLKYKEGKGLSSKTISHYKQALEEFRYYMQTHPIDDLYRLKFTHIKGFLKSMSKGWLNNYSNYTRQNDITTLKQFFKYLYKEGKIKDDKFKYLLV